MTNIILQNNVNRSFLITSLMLLVFTLTGCDFASDSGSQSRVTLQFNTTNSSSGSKAASASLQSSHDSLVVEGTNGSLQIDDIRFIVKDFELERSEGECEGIADEDDCEEVEADPFFVDLPLQSDSINLGTNTVEAGLYEELEFEVDDLEIDEEDDTEERRQKEELLAQIHQTFPDWPATASMIISGNFTSSQGDTAAFTVFAEAEVEIELEFNPPFEVTGDEVNKLVRVNINPSDWFLRADGTVFDLSQYDYESTGSLLEFEVEIENGFKSVEVDDNNDDDND